MVMLSRRSALALPAGLLVPAVSPVWAQTPVTTRIRGDIEALDGQDIRIVSRSGQKVSLRLAGDMQVQAVVPISIDAIRPGSFIGSAAVTQPDGTLRALEVHVFPEAMRGTGEGHRPFDLGPESTMTNGTVGDVVLSSGRTLKVGYKGGEKTIVVPPETPIVTYEPGSRALLVNGAHVIVFATEGPANSLTATRIAVGKDGLVPPM
jgi:hypothetical protein